MREYLAATTAFDYQHTVNAALSGNLQALNACVECCDCLLYTSPSQRD